MSGYYGFSSSGGGGGGGGTPSLFNDLFPTEGTAAGFTDGTYLRPAKVHDLDTSGTNEFNIGVNLRSYGNGQSKEIGINSNPLTVNFPSSYYNFYKQFSPNEFTEVDIHQPYQINSYIYSNRTSSGGLVNYLTSTGSIGLSTNTSNGSLSEIRTNQFYRLQLGKVSIIRQALLFSSSGTNNTTKFGLFDDNYGFYFKVSNSVFSVGFIDTMSSGITNEFSNSSFNYDKLDGSGPSGLILDLTKYNLYEIRVAWHGILNLQFFVNGNLCHTFNIQNISTKPILQINKLPISVKLENTAVSTSTSVEYNSASILIQNGTNSVGNTFSISNSNKKSIKTEYPLLSIRLKSTINTITNRLVIVPKLLSLYNTKHRVKYRLVLNPTLTASSFTDVNTNSGAQYDESATALSGGEEIYCSYLANDNDCINLDLNNIFNLYKKNIKQNAFGTSVDILTISVESEVNGFASVSSTILWDEV